MINLSIACILRAIAPKSQTVRSPTSFADTSIQYLHFRGLASYSSK
ncbi:hypothetical protein NDA03_20200 [Trichocoleus sp. Lan]